MGERRRRSKNNQTVAVGRATVSVGEGYECSLAVGEGYECSLAVGEGSEPSDAALENCWRHILYGGVV